MPISGFSQTTQKGPVSVRFVFDHTLAERASTDYYETCNQGTTVTGCQRFLKDVVIQEGANPGTWSVTQSYTAGPYTVALRACNIAGCSAFSNSIQTPTIVSTAPGIPGTLRVVIVIPTP